MFWERFYNLCIEREIKPNNVAKALELSTAVATKWKKGTIPNGDALIKIADYFNVSVDYLLGRTKVRNLDNNSILNELNNLTSKEINELKIVIDFLKYRRKNTILNDVSTLNQVTNENSVERIKEESTVYLPILGQAAAGKPIEIIEVYEGDVKVGGNHDKSNSFIIKARGDSMVGAGINDKDLVVFKTQPAVENGEIALMNVNGEATIKYFYLRNGICELHSANPAYPPMEYTSGDIKVLGKFVEVIEQR